MKKLNILILTMTALAGFFALTFGAPRSWAQGVDNNAVFELDGNTQDNPAFAGLDWESTFPPNTPLTPNPIQDPAPVTIFTTGGSKYTNNVSQWRHKSGSVPDKDNILQAVAAALALPNGDTAVYSPRRASTAAAMPRSASGSSSRTSLRNPTGLSDPRPGKSPTTLMETFSCW